MKSLYITFTDNEFRRLLKAKNDYAKTGRISWHQFILIKCCNAIKKNGY